MTVTSTSMDVASSSSENEAVQGTTTQGASDDMSIEAFDKANSISPHKARIKRFRQRLKTFREENMDWWDNSYLFDWVLSVIIFLIEATVIYLAVEPFKRHLIEKDPSLSYPVLPDIVPAWALFIIIGPVPIFIFLIVQIWKRSLHDFHHACLGLLEGFVLTNLVTDVLKVSAGRYRPAWLNMCDPSTDTTCSVSGIYAKDGRFSFPSGHSSSSMFASVYLCLYLSAKLGLFQRKGHSAHMWKAFISILPLGLGFFVSISRTRDYHHDFSDIIAGALIGAGFGIFAYHLNYPCPLLEEDGGDGIDYAAESKGPRRFRQRIKYHAAFGGGNPRNRRVRSHSVASSSSVPEVELLPTTLPQTSSGIKQSGGPV